MWQEKKIYKNIEVFAVPIFMVKVHMAVTRLLSTFAQCEEASWLRGKTLHLHHQTSSIHSKNIHS